MVELLAPAGTMEALKAAVNCGCDAIYLGMTKFGARAYATNFDSETIKEAIEYCHLNNVKIYVNYNATSNYTIDSNNVVEAMSYKVVE